MTDNLNDRVRITFDSNGNVIQDSQFSKLSNEQQQWGMDLVRDIVSGQSNVINTLINYTTRFPEDANIPGSEAAKSVFGTVDITLSYLKYRDEQRALNSEHYNTYKDEMNGAFNTAANSYISGELAAQAGLGILAFGMPLSYAVGGAIFVGWASGKAYDAYLKDDVDTIVDHFFSDQNTSGSWAIAIDSKSQALLNYTPIPGTVLSSSQSQAKAIELLNNLSGGQVLNYTPIPQKIIVNYSSQSDAYSDIYNIKSGDTISSIAKSLGISVENLISLNSWLEEEGRISDDGKFILIKPDEKLRVASEDNDATYTLPAQYVTDEEGNIIFDEDGNIKYKDINSELNKVLSQNNGQSQEQKAQSWLESIGSSIKDWVSDLGETITGFMSNVVEAVGSAFTSVGDWFSSIFSNGASDHVYDSSQIDNSLLDLDIRTDRTQGFLSNEDTTQTGNVIGDGDWELSGPIDNINGDGSVNTIPWGIAADQLNAARQTISDSENFARDLNVNFDTLNSFIVSSTSNNSSYLQSSFFNSSFADIANQTINARNFLNIDPVVLDLNGDGVKLISYNDSEVTFDVDNDGKQERTGWVRNQEEFAIC